MSPKTTPSAPTTSAVLPTARRASASMRQGYGPLARFESREAWRPLGENESEDEDDDEDALSRVDDDPHPRTLEPARGIGEADDVHEGGGNAPRLMQVVGGEQHPVGDPVPFSKGAVHSRQ